MSSYQDFLNQPKSKNIAHNGDFQIWQRGSSFAAYTTGLTADRWEFGETAATCVCSVDRDASNIPHPNTLQSYKVTATT